MLYWTLLLSLMLALPTVSALADLDPADKQKGPVFLQQNWDNESRTDYYSRSQGSQMMPYAWAKALEHADSRKWFFSGGLKRHGYISRPKSLSNPDGFPVGFVLDSDAGGDWLGMNCSACHTNQIKYKKTLIQIDGAPAHADMYGLLADLEGSLIATAKDSKKFERFAKKVLGSAYSPTKAITLLRDLKKFTRYWTAYVKASTTKVKWGHTRLDAFGMIYNRVSAIDLHMPRNNRPPNAPVSYPFLWGASYENVVQWNGSAPNYNKNILIADLQRLARNVGEVLGVFANTDIKKPTLLRPYYVTTARRTNQFKLEGHLMNLWSPKWPENVLGDIDLIKAAKGQKLFQKNCVSCHTVVPYGQQKTPVTVTMTPLKEIGTDPAMATNACSRMVDSGKLEGAKMPPLLGPALPKKTRTLDLVANVTIGAILNPHMNSDPTNSVTDLDEQAKHTERLRNLLDLTKQMRQGENLSSGDKDTISKIFNGYQKNRPKAKDCNDSNPLMAYKGRPLDGIWATAPYLHNGSVANLYELLLPAKKRLKKFHVGSSEFDPQKVGFVSNSGPFELDTSLPGNSNAGHDTYGNSVFTEEDRWALVEYLKTL